MSFGTRTLPGGWDITPSAAFVRTFERADSAGTDTAAGTKLTPSGYFRLESPDYGITRLSFTEALSYSDSRQWTKNLGTLTVRRFWRNAAGAQATQRLFGAFNTNQSLSFTQTGILSDTPSIQPAYSASLGVSFPMYKVFGLEVFGLHGLLHTATPAFGLNYEPAVLPGGFLGRPRLDSVQSASLTASLENGFQVKAGPDRRKLDIGRLRLGTSHDLKTGRLAPVSADLSINPLLPFRAADTGRSRRRFDVRIDAVGSFDAGELKPGEDYSLRTNLMWDWMTHDSLPGSERGIRLNANHVFGRSQNMLIGSVTAVIPGWSISLNSLGYNFALRQLTDYSLTVVKDLHCWEALVNLSGLGKTWRYDFEFRIKKLPDVRFGKSTFRTFLPGIR
uniref:LPS-assembly protein LptD n=1 Tax=candidate division WOR-3 bacterium TaxID=2052148 RepID=A0A7C4GJP3_UNCW3